MKLELYTNYGMAHSATKSVFTAVYKEITMRSYIFHFQRIRSLFLKIALAAFLLFTLIGCSGGNQAEIDQSTTENETLHTELDKANADLQAAEATIKELEDKLDAMQAMEATVKELEDKLDALQTAQAEPEEPASEPINITPPERTPAELLLGQWFYHEFHEEGVWSFTQTLSFRENGTGTISQTYYIPEDEAEDYVLDLDGNGTYKYLLHDVDMSDEFSWTLDGNELFVDVNDELNFTLIVVSAQELDLRNGEIAYSREMPTGMEGYVERALYTEDVEAKEAARRRRFLGTWYYDVLTWTFSEDGTGVWDIPELGDQPAEKRKFTYEVDDDYGVGDYLCLTINWENSDYWMFFPTFNADGSMSLTNVGQSEPIMKWTRSFDADNCPITAQIISNGLEVFSGSMFDDLLGGN